jgi:RNA polymerase sigma factor (sigma-70 family)
LQRFARRGEAAGFEALVDRYAALVWGVCQRTADHDVDREDAFQATFLALLQRASSLDANTPLGGWLHTVALRVSLKARARSRRWRARLPEDCPARRDVNAEVSSRELLRLVDEEIERLPKVLRLPVILCCLDGKARDEAAELVGCSTAALKSRLERGRQVLRERLKRGGIELPAAFLVLSLSSGQVSATLRERALLAALSAPPHEVATLASAAGLALSAKMTLSVLCLAAVGALCLGTMGATKAEPPNDASSAPAGLPPERPVTALDKPQVDRFGDALPHGAVRRFGTLRFRQDEIVEIAFTPDGKHVLAGMGRHPVAVFDALTGQRLRKVGKTSANNNYGFALSPDGRQLACCGYDVSIWDFETGKLLRELGAGRCSAIAYSPDGTKIAVSREYQATWLIYDSATGRELAKWSPEGAKNWTLIASLAFSADGKQLAALVHEFREVNPGVLNAVSSRVRLWDAEKGTAGKTLGPIDDDIAAIALEPTTKQLATIGKDNTIRLWDLATGECQRQISVKKRADSIKALRFSTDGQRCVVCGSGKSLSILNVKDGKELLHIKIGDKNYTSPVAMALSPDGRTLAYGKLYGESCVRVWDVDSGKERLADSGHRSPATLTLSPDGRTLVSRGKSDRQEFHWDLQTGEGRRHSVEPREEAGTHVQQGDAWLVQYSRWKLKLYVSGTHMEVWSLDGSRRIGRTATPSAIRGTAVSPDGTQLALAFQDGSHSVLLWNPEKEE